MTATAFGHQLETLHDGATALLDGKPAPLPLKATSIEVDIQRGLATIRTTRIFRNDESRPIEAILTMPVGFDTVVTGMTAQLDGRVLTAQAQPKEVARDTYEAGLDAGKTSLLHEEVLCGVHMLSVGQVGPGVEVEVTLDAVTVLSGGPVPRLRIPVTVGQLYGASPLAPADDLVTSPQVHHAAELTVRSDAGAVRLNGARLLEPGEQVMLPLDAAIEIGALQGGFGAHVGVAADGRQVRLDLRPAPVGSAALDLAVLVDRSGSTGSAAARNGTVTVWEAIRDGLADALLGLGGDDGLSLWQFDSECQHLGRGIGRSLQHLPGLLGPPRGGTELGAAVAQVLASGARDVLVLTDGQTWANDIDGLLAASARISAILVGPGSLDANIGRICAQTGGQVFFAAGEDVATPLKAALEAARGVGGPVSGVLDGPHPMTAQALRGGVEVTAEWTGTAGEGAADPVGRYAAALALPLMTDQAFDSWATAHGLCTHRTSLVLVDDAGERYEGLSQMRKVPLMEAMARPVASAPIAGMAMRFAPVMRQAQDSPAASLQKDSHAFSQPAMDWMEAGQSVEKPKLLRRWDSRDTGAAQDVFQGFDWLGQGDALLRGDLTALTVEQLAEVGRRVTTDRVARLAQDHGLDREQVALALIALDTAPRRVAQRFAAKVFVGVPKRLWIKG